MNYIRNYKLFKESNVLSHTSWEREVDGETIKITLQDILDYLDNGQEINPKDLESLLIDTERDSDRVESSDLDYPIIVLSSGGELKSILDGQHRVTKALRDGVNVKVRILDLDTAPDNFKSVLGN